jgi:2-polyprenyl-6-methoxyphenol hydroxylase-like FAD-dependent oxidoreductase
MENRWRRFDELPRWPEGLVAVGDAVCSFNPLYGQGMTMSARAALTLRKEFAIQARLHPDGALPGLAVRVQKAVGREQRVAWFMATGEDFRYPGTTGGRSAITRLSHAYIDRVVRASASDRVVQRAFLQVMHMMQPPTAWLAPDIARRVLLNRPNAGVTPDHPPASPIRDPRAPVARLRQS